MNHKFLILFCLCCFCNGKQALQKTVGEETDFRVTETDSRESEKPAMPAAWKKTEDRILTVSECKAEREAKMGSE